MGPGKSNIRGSDSHTDATIQEFPKSGFVLLLPKKESFL